LLHIKYDLYTQVTANISEQFLVVYLELVLSPNVYGLQSLWGVEYPPDIPVAVACINELVVVSRKK